MEHEKYAVIICVGRNTIYMTRIRKFNYVVKSKTGI
jgi:hypothetical protein